MESETDPQRVYEINPDAMEHAIESWLTPVVNDLKRINGGFTQAHAEAKTAHDSEAAGWFGAVGNNEVRWATSSFLNETEWQLRQLTEDHDQLAAALEEYRGMLLEHVKKARAMDTRNAERFRSIERDLDERAGR